MLLNIYKIEKEGLLYICEGAFIGLKDEVYKNIRSVTTKGKEIHE